MMHHNEVLNQSCNLPWLINFWHMPRRGRVPHLTKLENIPRKTSLPHCFIYHFRKLVHLFSQYHKYQEQTENVCSFMQLHRRLAVDSCAFKGLSQSQSGLQFTAGAGKKDCAVDIAERFQPLNFRGCLCSAQWGISADLIKLIGSWLIQFTVYILNTRLKKSLQNFGVT